MMSEWSIYREISMCWSMGLHIPANIGASFWNDQMVTALSKDQHACWRSAELNAASLPTFRSGDRGRVSAACFFLGYFRLQQHVRLTASPSLVPTWTEASPQRQVDDSSVQEGAIVASRATWPLWPRVCYHCEQHRHLLHILLAPWYKVATLFYPK